MSTFEYWYDFSSPFSYLASTQVEAIAARHGATLVWRPMLLGALFKSLGTPMAPIQAAAPAKQRYVALELRYWSSHWGVPFRWSSHFPLRTVTPLRLAILAGERIAELSHALYEAAWVRNLDIGQDEVLAPLLAERGFDPDLLERTREPGVKQALADSTAAALAAGVFGAPTFVVKRDDGDLLFWGQDRLPFVEKALQGWRPAAG
jgi:2-hydroxychromene-2-carboxylate isomerase